METHVKVLGVLYIIWHGLCLIAGLGVLALFGVLGTVGTLGAQTGGEAASVALGTMGIASFIGICFLILALPGLLAGFGLLKFRPWARILVIILSILNLFNFPFGTALGIYGLVVLFSSETDRLFASYRAY